MSIGILVDGTYKQNPTTQALDYSPRSPEDLKQIESLVKTAVGFDADRNDKIEVINMQFSNDLEVVENNDSDWWREELPNLFQTVIFAIVVLLVLITVIRPIALKAFDVKKSSDIEGEGEVMFTSSADSLSATAPNVATTPSPQTTDSIAIEAQQIPKENPIKKVNNFVDAHPQELVNVLRKWLNEEV